MSVASQIKDKGGHNFFTLGQWFLTWGKFTPRGKFHFPMG